LTFPMHRITRPATSHAAGRRQGKRHMIAYYPGDIPTSATTCWAAKMSHGDPGRRRPKWTDRRFQAYQARWPDGRDHADERHRRAFLPATLSSRQQPAKGKWSVPVNVNQQRRRKTFHNTQTSAQSNVGAITSCLPGPGAVAFDRDGISCW